ncbi:MAG: hypothetical protein KGL39_18865 [Patescibacteria group bacterium]|nr:hypothetical protein [Patescibacteria group bacterium]
MLTTMKFCPNCERVMVWNTDTGDLVYTCTVCGQTEPGDDWDVRVAGSSTSSSETKELYKNYLAIASHDRTAQLVARDCTKCGLDYMTQVRVGSNELVVFTCKCGAQEFPAGGDSSQKSDFAILGPLRSPASLGGPRPPRIAPGDSRKPASQGDEKKAS